MKERRINRKAEKIICMEVSLSQGTRYPGQLTVKLAISMIIGGRKPGNLCIFILHLLDEALDIRTSTLLFCDCLYILRILICITVDACYEKTKITQFLSIPRLYKIISNQYSYTLVDPYQLTVPQFVDYLRR